jgi:ADP-ribose pyrophosphatase
MHAFVATGLRPVGQALDASEQITPVPVRWDQAMQMVKSGEIADAKTLAGLLYYHMLVGSGGGPVCPSASAPR